LVRLPQLLAQWKNQAVGTFSVGRWKDRHELVAAGPTADVIAANAALEEGGDPAKRLVPCGVTSGIVDLLEQVDVDHQDRRSAMGATLSALYLLE